MFDLSKSITKESKQTRKVLLVIFAVVVSALSFVTVLIYTNPDNTKLTQLLYTCPRSGDYNQIGNDKWINCMPSFDMNNKSSKYCRGDMRKWVQDNCPGIGFAD